MQNTKSALILLSFLLISRMITGSLSAQVVTINPEIIPVGQGAIQNAGSGTEVWSGGPRNGMTNLVNYAVRVSDYSVNSMIRVGWDAYESNRGEYHFDKMDIYFERCLKFRQKLNIGCFVTSRAGTKQKIDGAYCCYPAYVHEAMQQSTNKDTTHKIRLSAGHITDAHWEPDFENETFFERYNALLAAFAAYLEQPITVDGKSIQRKKLVRHIEMRHFGFWGEGASKNNLVPSGSEYLIRFADAYARHFPDIRLLVPTNGMVYIPTVYGRILDYHFHLMTMRNRAGLMGIFKDNWGCYENGGYQQKIFYEANLFERNGVRLYELIRDRWQNAPLTGEPGKWGPTEYFHPYRDICKPAAYLHPVVIRNCNVSTGRYKTNPTDYSILNDEKALKAFHRLYSIIGFRYLFTEARMEHRDNSLKMEIDWLNIGLTPTYDHWKIRFFVKDISGEEIWSDYSSFDFRTLLPDSTTPPGVVNADKVQKHIDLFDKVPAEGRLFMQIVDPDEVSPCMALSIQGRNACGAYLLTELSCFSE
ncbi:MAG: hypothetical protein R6V06_09665 [Kiritimatiellia bacterium]